VSVDRSPAISIRLPPGTTDETRERLAVLLADHDVVAIQEDDVQSPRVWTVHFESAPARDAAAAAMRQFPGLEGAELQAIEVADEDWARRTQADLPAIRIGRVIVAPPWDVPRAEASRGELVIVIEPSRGFGTGHHQSTRLCLLLLQGVASPGGTVLDVGTGSGVLAIAAARLGAAYVSAIDADPDAVENARENIARNAVASVVEAHVRDVSQDSVPPADLVLANLTGTLLARLADRLAALVRPSGRLIVSGFTADERGLVEHALSRAFQVTESAEEDGWQAMVLTRVPPGA